MGSSFIFADPDRYESTLVAIVKGGFNPLPANTDILSGDKTINDGFGDITLYTDPKAAFANTSNLPFNANYYGIVFSTEDENGNIVPQHRIRTADDIVVLSSVIEISPVIITGFMSDASGGDGNYEYMQFMATRDIDFSATPFSVVVTNNAGASSPSGFPAKGWATGSDALPKTNSRTFKFNLSSGFAAKGSFFYVGGASKLINGSESTSISGSNWIRAFDYTKTDGDGFGNKTSGLFANSGNASGFAVFEGTNVTADSKPLDVIFVGGGGSLFSAGPPALGYRIPNNDFYDIIDPITLQAQPFYRSGTNTLSYNYNGGQGYFYRLGGVYNPALGRWVQARSQNT
ncbi:MAG TPA: hypothetical protein VFS31_18935, partial [Chitinophagaceae bacterium]|nr:hypothetical protein [Chitinophagaceae bacterium]